MVRLDQGARRERLSRSSCSSAATGRRRSVMLRSVLLVALVASCRTEVPRESSPALASTGQPVAQVETPPTEDVSDVRDQLPPSLYEEANGGDPKPKHAKKDKPSKMKDADDVVA